MNSGSGGRLGSLRRVLGVLLLALLVVTLLWWVGGRVTAESRRLAVRELKVASGPLARADSTLRILAWNLAHGRGDEGPGLLRNWRGGSAGERAARLARIADVLERADADVVVLNEVDFRSSWSGGVNQAEVLARAAGYPIRVEQRNYDVRLLLASFSFGNALLSRLPVREARWLDIPPHSRIEAAALGAKGASVVRIESPLGPVAVIPVHLEARSGRTRRAAVPVFRGVRAREPAPVILAGDFNASPAGWPGAAEPTLLGELLDLGWRSPRALGSPSPEEWTFPTYAPERAVDWILVEPPLRAGDVRVLKEVERLSDHAPVLAVVRLGGEG